MLKLLIGMSRPTSRDASRNEGAGGTMGLNGTLHGSSIIIDVGSKEDACLVGRCAARSHAQPTIFRLPIFDSVNHTMRL